MSRKQQDPLVSVARLKPCDDSAFHTIVLLEQDFDDLVEQDVESEKRSARDAAVECDPCR